MEANVSVIEDNVVETDVLDDDGVVKLRKPLSNGSTTLVLDFDKLTGGILIKCQARARKLDPGMTVPILSDAYLALVAAAVLGIKYDELISLSAPDFTAVTIRVQNFLAGSR